MLKRWFLALVLIAAVALLVRWRISVIHEAGRAFAADRLHAISNNAETLMRAWLDDHRRLGERIARAYLSDDPRQQTVASSSRATLLGSIVGDDEVAAARLLRGHEVLTTRGDAWLTGDAAVALADTALAAGEVLGGALLSRGEHLRMPVAIPYCALPASPSACVVVLLEIDPRPRLFEGLRGMRGAGRTSRYVVVFEDGRIAPISHAAATGTIDPVYRTHDVPMAVTDSALHGRASFYERVDSVGTTVYGVARRMNGMGFGLLREATREEAMANHERQVKLEAILALAALVLIAFGWFGYDRTIGAARARRMAAAEARLATVVRTASDAILIVNESGRIDVANDSASQLLGVPSQELVGTRLNDWLDAGSSGAIFRLHQTLEHESGAPVHLGHDTDFQIVRRDGTVHHCEASIASTGGASGSYALIVRDVTARKDLEERVRQSERLAAVSRFVGGVAHELNNPLAVISLTSELMGDRPRDAGDAEDLQTMRRAASRAARIVRDLLRYIEEFPLMPGVVSVARLLDDLEREMKPWLTMLGVELRRGPVDPDLRIQADAAAIQQALGNLVMNGAQAAGPGGHVSIELEAADQVLHLRVTDSGPGVPSEVAPRIFEPFFTTRSVGEGTGLGLSVSLGVIAKHQGTLILDKGHTNGASFLVTLPLSGKAA